jgi:hypothetical protein
VSLVSNTESEKNKINQSGIIEKFSKKKKLKFNFSYKIIIR